MAYDIGPRIGLEGEKQFREALRAVSTKMKELGSEAKLVASQFGTNEKSMASYSARNEQLSRAIGETSNNIALLTGHLERQRSRMAELAASVARASEEYGENSAEVARAQVAYQKQATAVSRTETEVNKLQAALNQNQRELAENTEEMKRLKNALETVNGDSGKVALSMNNLNKALSQGGEAAKAMGGRLKEVGASMKQLGGNLSRYLTAPLLALGAVATKGTEELRGDLARLNTNAQQTGVSTDLLSKSMMQLAAVTGEADSNVEALSNLMQAGFGDSNMQAAIDALSGAVIRFPDTLKLEGLADGLQETIATGAAIGPFAELLERLGINVERFDQGLQQAIKNGQEQNYVLQTLAKTGLTETYEAYVKTNDAMVKSREAQYRLSVAMAKLGDTLTPLLTKLTELATVAVTWFNGLSEGGQNAVLGLAAAAAALGPLLMGIGSMVSGVGWLVGNAGKLKGALALLKVAFAALTGPIGIAIAAGVAVGAAIYALYERCEWFRDAVDAIFEAVGATFSAFAAGVKKWITSIVDYVKALPGRIRDAFEAAKTAVVTKVKEIIEGVKKRIGEIKDFFVSLPETLKEIGINIMQGLWEGIKSKFKEIQDGLSDFFGRMVDGVKSFLGIRSPSRVFAGIGKNMAAGLEQGYTGGLHKIAINKTKVPVPDPYPKNPGRPGGAPQAGAIAQHITVTVQADDLQQVTEMVRLFNRIGQTARAGTVPG